MQQNDIKRVLISVTDKKGIVEFAQGLQPFGVEILSTGGTAAQLRKSGVPVTNVSDYTGFPEMMDGRLKTLHPKILAEMKEMGGKISEATNFELAKKTFQLTARYDGAISNYLGLLTAGSPEKSEFPDTFSCQFAKAQDLRYGENPHQTLN